MRIETFRSRLESGKPVNYLYHVDDLEGLISAWRYREKFVLTWEECAKGDMFDESNYTRDEVHHFNDVDGVIAFLQTNNVEPEKFTP